MGLVWDVLKDITKTVINVHSLGAFDVKVAGETEDGSSGSSGIRRSDTVSKISPADSSLGD